LGHGFREASQEPRQVVNQGRRSEAQTLNASRRAGQRTVRGNHRCISSSDFAESCPVSEQKTRAAMRTALRIGYLGVMLSPVLTNASDLEFRLSRRRRICRVSAFVISIKSGLNSQIRSVIESLFHRFEHTFWTCSLEKPSRSRISWRVSTVRPFQKSLGLDLS
jgi:hypothetical protein